MDKIPPKKPKIKKKGEPSGSQQTPTTADAQEIVHTDKLVGLAKTQPGVAYQIKLLMLFFKRGANQGYSFQLNTEDGNAGKLDDVVFAFSKIKEKIENGIRYLQAKYSKDKTKRVQFSDLLKETDKLFGLIKYFRSFLEIHQLLKSEGKESAEIIKQITMCTNIKFHEDLEKCLWEIDSDVTKDDILYGNIILNRYTFKKNDEQRHETHVEINKRASKNKVKEDNGKDFKEKKKEVIAELLLNASDLHMLAKQFAEDLSTTNPTIPFKGLYKTYHGWLVRNIFDISEESTVTETDDSHKWHVKFRKNFIEIKEGDLKNFRDMLLKEMTVTDIQTVLQNWNLKKIPVSEPFCRETEWNEETPQDVNKLAKALAKALNINAKLSFGNKLFSSNHAWLLNNVFYVPNHHVKIRDNFINNKCDEKEVKEFRKLIDTYLNNNEDRSKTIASLIKTTVTLANNFFTTPDTARVPNNLSDSKDLVETFLDKLVFVVTCDEETLGAVVQEELGKEMNLIENDVIARSLEVEMLNFMKDKKKDFLSEDSWEEFKNKHFAIISRLALIGPTDKRKRNIQQFNCRFEKLQEGEIENQEKKARVLDTIIATDRDSRLLIIYQKYPLLTEIKIHQAYEHCEVDAYIVDDLKCSINSLNSTSCTLKAFSSKKSSRLVIINDEEKIDHKGLELLKAVAKILHKNKEKRLILITPGKDVEICNMFEDFLETYEELRDNDTFLDLTVPTQQLLEKRKVLFHGREEDLSKLIADDKIKSLIKGDILMKLITDSEKITIGETPLHQSNLDTFDEIKNYYIRRSLFRLITIKNDIYNDETFCCTNDNKIKSDLNDREIVLISKHSDASYVFDELCKLYDDKNIHWLKEYPTNDLVWQETRGNVSNLHVHADRHCKIHDHEVGDCEDDYTYKENDVMGLSEKLVVVVADAGMGKSTLMTHLASINNNNDVIWIVRMNLKYYTENFSRMKENIDKRDAIAFLYEVLKFQVTDIKGDKKNIFEYATLTHDLISLNIDENIKRCEFKMLEIEVFNNFFNKGKVILMLDGFDEVVEGTMYLEDVKAIDWINEMNKLTKIQKIWLTTRPNEQWTLENKLGVFSYQLNPISKKSKKFVKRFWETRLNIKIDERSDVYIEEMFSISSPIKSESYFIGVPLHIRMIAEIYEEEFQQFYYSGNTQLTEDQRGKIKKHSLLSLYDTFFEKQFEILHKDIDGTQFKNKRMLKAEQETIKKHHRKLSLIETFKENGIEDLLSRQDLNEIETKFKENEVIGMVVRDVKEKPRFVHHTFADYFTAHYLVDRLERGQNLEVYESVQKYLSNRDSSILLKDLNLNKNPKALLYLKLCIKLDAMKFVNYYLVENNDLLNGVLNGDLQILNENDTLEGIRDRHGRTPLHLVCCNNKLDNFEYVFEKHPEAIKSKDTLFGWTPLHYAIASHTTCDSLTGFDFEFLKNAMEKYGYDVNQTDLFDETLLMLSIKNNCTKQCFFKFLIRFSLDLDYVNRDGKTALHCTSRISWREREYLFEHADLNKGKTGNKPIDKFFEKDDLENEFEDTFDVMKEKRGEDYVKNWIKVSVQNDKDLIVKLLNVSKSVANFILDLGIDINFIDSHKYTALKYAITEGHKSWSKTGFNLSRIDYNGDIHFNDIDKYTKFHMLLAPSQLEKRMSFIYFLLKAGAFYDDVEGDDWSKVLIDPDYFFPTIKALFGSIRNNNIVEVENIMNTRPSNGIDKDVLVNIRTRKTSMAPLHYAADLGHKDIVLSLLNHGAFYNSSDEKRKLKTPEELTKNQEIADILAKTRKLFNAVKGGNIENVLKYMDGNVNYKDRKERQPIHLAIEGGHIHIVNHLLENEAELYTKTLTNSTVLHVAAASNNTNLVTMLLNSIATEKLQGMINIKDIYGKTALDIAIKHKNRKASHDLRLMGAERSALSSGNPYKPVDVEAWLAEEEF